LCSVRRTVAAYVQAGSAVVVGAGSVVVVGAGSVVDAPLESPTDVSVVPLTAVVLGGAGVLVTVGSPVGSSSPVHAVAMSAAATTRTQGCLRIRRP